MSAQLTLRIKKVVTIWDSISHLLLASKATAHEIYNWTHERRNIHELQHFIEWNERLLWNKHDLQFTIGPEQHDIDLSPTKEVNQTGDR